MPGGRAEAGVKGGQSLMEKGRLGLGGDEDRSSGGGTYGGGGVDRQDINGYGLNRWEDNVANIILGTEYNDPLAYAPELEPHHPIVSILGGHRGQLEVERDRDTPDQSK